MRTGNPTLSDKAFSSVVRQSGTEAVMTIGGTINKTMLCLFMLAGTAMFTWNSVSSTPAGSFPVGWLIGALVGSIILALVTIFYKKASPITVPLYALVEGVLLGAISWSFESQYPGIVAQAVALTFGTLFALLIAYQTRLIRATENFKLGVVAATGGIAVIYLISMLGSLFGFNIPYIHESGTIGIAFSLFVVVVAALNLVLDFDFIENGAERGAPKYMEWYGAFGLLVTLIWLYLEMLRLLAKLRSR